MLKLGRCAFEECSEPAGAPEAIEAWLTQLLAGVDAFGAKDMVAEEKNELLLGLGAALDALEWGFESG